MTHHEDSPPYGSTNLAYVETLYRQYLTDPQSLTPEWLAYFREMNNEPPLVSPAEENEQTGTYDLHVTADPHPIIHRAEDRKEPVGAPDRVRDFLSRVPIFEGAGESGIETLAGITRPVTFERGHYLCNRGQTGNDLFLILSGSVSIMKNEKEITTLGPGEMVGELAVFDVRPRSADIICKSTCEVLQIKREDLQKLLRSNPDLTLNLLRVLSTRLRDAGTLQERVDRMVRAYRERGHVRAKLDPLGYLKEEHPELTLKHYGFTEKDLDIKFTVNLGGVTSGRPLGSIINILRNIYCQAIGVQYMHIDDLRIQEWLRVRLEKTEGKISLDREEQLRILKKLTDAEVFERFLHRKFVGAKRFSLEGGESLIPLLDYAIDEAGRHQIDEVIIAMAHRGRLNVLVNIMGKPASQVFREFQDVDPELHRGKGDVKYHLGYGHDRMTSCGRRVHLSLCFNPSHLEFAGPVALGRVRAKQDFFGDWDRSRALPLLIHGDAAFVGQGVNQEIFNLSELPGYTIGGSVHVVLNNQIGFTTNPEESRSTYYSTDLARMLQIPIFHVNGEHPEAVAHVIRLAMEFRQTFKKDVVIDMYCYRKYGHNEGDDPSFTQPMLYAAVKKRKTVREAYVENLLKLDSHITAEEAEGIALESKEDLEKGLEASQDPNFEYRRSRASRGLWADYKGGGDDGLKPVETAVPKKNLVRLLKALSKVPEDFTPHPKIKRFLKNQEAMAAGEIPLSWGVGEALAFASLLSESRPVRVTGQDTERGTFSHRHAVLHDHKNGQRFVPLKSLSYDQGTFEIYNSPLSEVAVLGFEYGYSLDQPTGLAIWEAQFGDFCNVGQVIIDQFISSCEEKWQRLSGLCMFLPHGFEGQGPEHSSARLERFLMLAAVHNIQVVNMTTPAQLFHCLRRQVIRPLRKPLIVMSPKSLLRHPKAVSSLDDLAEGAFQKIIPDPVSPVPDRVRRILLCAGKLYFELEQARKERGLDGVAILRMEQYYPLPAAELAEALEIYPKGTPVVWVQEEPLNMGAWPFLRLRFVDRIEGHGSHPLSCVTRPEAASPATGSAASHRIEQDKLIGEALEFLRDPTGTRSPACRGV